MAVQPVQLKNTAEQIQPRELPASAQPFDWVGKFSRAVGNVLFNLIPVAIVVVFFWLQGQIGAGGGWLGMAGIGMSVIVELVLVFIWSLFVKHEH